MDQIKIGKFIAECRKKNNLTQMQLAEKLNITDRAVSKWENGKAMPDSGIMLDLCNELKISVNELLSGERIKKEEEQKKFEENVLNTLDYSNKKINHTKLILKIILGAVIAIVGILFVFFGIDVFRMKNNKPVFFSTWGFSYAPPINLDVINIEKAIKNYLIEEDEKNKHHENEKSFVAMKTYLIEDKENKVYIYAWILQEKYYNENNEIIEDSGSSIPHKFEIAKENGDFVVTDYEIPRDGEYYERDMKNIFPKSVRDDMDKSQIDGTIEKLEIEIQEQVSLYFHK